MAATAGKFHKSPSEMLGILDESIAFAFDLQCARMLLESEREQEYLKLEAMSAGALSRALGSQTPTNSTGPLHGQYIGEVTQANFRDQGF